MKTALLALLFIGQPTTLEHSEDHQQGLQKLLQIIGRTVPLGGQAVCLGFPRYSPQGTQQYKYRESVGVTGNFSLHFF